ncbi:MAG: class I SAM-dependent methyltransferase [Acidimicrobiales bacterium]
METKPISETSSCSPSIYDVAIDYRGGSMRNDDQLSLDRVRTLIDPLAPEQALHFLDCLTWFPSDANDRAAQIAEYVHVNTRHLPQFPPVVYESLLQRLCTEFPDEMTSNDQMSGRWNLIPQAKLLYHLKYNLKHLLLPDDWFTFMNMGFASLDEPIRAPVDTGDVDIWRYSRALYTEAINGDSLEDLDVLEVGCGRGGGALHLSTSHHTRSYTGIDYSAENVSFCTRGRTSPGLWFQRGDAEQLDFPDDSFDAIVNVESAHCYPNFDKFVAEVVRLLRPGGRFYFSDEWWAVDVPNLYARLSDGGLRVLSSRDITPNIIRSLDCLRAIYPSFLAGISDSSQRGIWERFFSDRVCTNSAASYTSGRFVFLSSTLTPVDVAKVTS